MTEEKKFLKSGPNETLSYLPSISKPNYCSTDSNLGSELPSNERGWLHGRLTFRTRKRLEIFSLVLAVAVVLGLFSIPIIMHIRYQVLHDKAPILTLITLMNLPTVIYHGVSFSQLAMGAHAQPETTLVKCVRVSFRNGKTVLLEKPKEF